MLQRASLLSTRVFPDATSSGGTAAKDRELGGLEGLVAATFSARAMTLGPQLAPQIGVPLGWVLSQETEDSMRDALDSYLRCAPATAPGFDPCTQTMAFNQLAELLGVPRCWNGADHDGDVEACSAQKG